MEMKNEKKLENDLKAFYEEKDNEAQEKDNEAQEIKMKYQLLKMVTDEFLYNYNNDPYAAGIKLSFQLLIINIKETKIKETK